MYMDLLELEDILRWLEPRVQCMLFDRVLDQWKIWARARAILEEAQRNPREVRHLLSVVTIGPHWGYLTYYGQPRCCSKCGLEGVAAYMYICVGA